MILFLMLRLKRKRERRKLIPKGSIPLIKMEEILDWLNNLFLFKIPLRNRAGEIITYALVSEEDFDRVNLVRWCLRNDYAINSFHGYMHRFILGLSPGDGKQVDHRNRIRSDNRRENIREATIAENNQNRPKPKGTSIFRGVRFRGKKWVAGIKNNGNQEHIGVFTEEIEAAKAWNKRAIELGGFRQLNPV